MPMVPQLPLSRRDPLASVESSAAAADPKATQLTVEKILAACLLRDTKPRQSRLGVCSQRPPQLSLAEYQAAWKGVTSWLRANVHAQAVAGGEAKGVAVLGVGVVRHRGYGGAVHITVPYFELDEQFGRVYGLKGPKPSEPKSQQAPDNVIRLTGSELAAVVNHAAEMGGTAQLTEHQAAHALGSLSHGLGLALGVNWLSFKEGWHPVRLWLGFGFLCSDGTGVVSLSLAYYCQDKPPHRPHSARRFKASSPHHQLESREDQDACTPAPPSAPRSARARLQSRGVEHKGRRLVLQATIKDPLTPRQASVACCAARVCLPFVSVLETCNPLLPGCTRVAASMLSSPSSRIGVHYCSTRFLRLLADLTLNAGETAVGGEGRGREAQGHTLRRRKYMHHTPTTNHTITQAAPEDAKLGGGSAMGEGAWLHRYAECLRSLQHPTHHTTAAFRRQLTASLPAASQTPTDLLVMKQRQGGLPAGVMQRLGACALECATEGVETGIATQVLQHFQHRLCLALLDYVLLCPLEAHRLELEHPGSTHSFESARQREEYGRPIVYKDTTDPSPWSCLGVHERIQQQACFRSMVGEVDRRLWVCRGGLQLKQLLQDITTHNTFTLVELPASLVEGMSGPVSLLDFESRVSACLAQGRQQVSDCIISPAMQLLAKMMAQAPSNEATERLRRLGALLLRRTLRQVLRSSLLRLQAFFSLYDSPACHKPAAILLTAHWDAVNGAMVLELSAEQLLERLTTLLAQVAYAFHDPPPLGPSNDSDTSVPPLCLPEPCVPLPLSPVVGEEWGVDEEAMQLQALVSQLQHHAATIAHTAFTHAHTTTTTLLGPTCSRVVHSTAIAPAQIGQEAHQAVEGGVQVGMPQDNQTSKSISKGASPKPQPVWKLESSVGLQAVTAGLAHLRALTAALHESQHALLRHQWGLCSVDVSALVKDMQARLEHRLMQHRQGLTQVLQARVSEVQHGLKRVTRQSLRQALAHFTSGDEKPPPPSLIPTTDAPPTPPPSASIELMGLDELLSLEGYLHKHAGVDKDRFSRACGGVRVLEGVLVWQRWLSLSLGQHVRQAHHALRTFLTQLKWSGELVQRQRGAWDLHLSTKRKYLIAAATDTQHTLHTVLAARVLCPPLDLPQRLSEIEDTLQSLDTVLEQMQRQRHEATTLTHTMQRLGLGVMPIAGLEDGEGGAGEDWQLGHMLRRVWGALQSMYRHYKHYTHDAPLLLASLDVQQVESVVWAQEQSLRSLLHGLETGPWAMQLRGLRETCTQALRQLGHSRLRPRLPLLSALTCPHLTPAHWPALYTALGMPLRKDETGGRCALVLHHVLQHFEGLGSEEEKGKALAHLEALTHDAQRDTALATQLTHLHATLDALTIRTVLVQAEPDPASLASSPPPQCGLQLAPGALSRVEAAVCELQSRLSSLLPALPPSSLCYTELTARASSLSLRLSACASLLPPLAPLEHLPDYHTPPTLPLHSRLQLEQVMEQGGAMLRLLASEPRVSVLSTQAELRLRGKRLSQALAALDDERYGWRHAQQAMERKDTCDNKGEEQTRPASTVDSAATKAEDMKESS